MSVQFGRWNIDGQPVDPGYIEKVKPLLAPYGPDNEQAYTSSGLCIHYRAFHTTEESRRETQPHKSKSGAVITWDGRLDNRAELVRSLGGTLAFGATDVSIVAAAFNAWGVQCFANLIGDWALSIWDATSRSLILANDPIGTRHLYYSIEKDKVTWSTILDPLVLFAGKTFSLCEEYIAGWFSFYPAAHLTPYVGIHAVPPSAFVSMGEGKHVVSKYWELDPRRRIRYKSDAEYEEHFRFAFSESIERRLRSDKPVLAELSGGVDSSSIVCTADSLIASRGPGAQRLDTVSYYSDSEPNWNERPYFSIVEQKRRQVGCHIDVSSQNSLGLGSMGYRMAATPSAGERPTQASQEFAAHVTAGRYRVLLSGIGGDEFNGGVPTPMPELQDLFVRGEFALLARRLRVWALEKRRPWLHLFGEAVRGFLPFWIAGVSKQMVPPPWLNPLFAHRNGPALEGYATRLRLFGPLPTFQENQACLETIRRLMASRTQSSDPLYEKRYPYLDRNLLEFLCAIPREQLLRPGQRRSLMRRALADLVPAEILNRKRKGYLCRNPILALDHAWHKILEDRRALSGGMLGIFDAEKLAPAIAAATMGNEPRVTPLVRALILEFWFAHLLERNILCADRQQQVDLRP